MTATAQVKVAEPETVGDFYLMTSDSTSTAIPMKIGTIDDHKTIHQSIFEKSKGLGKKVAEAGKLVADMGGATRSLNTMAKGLQIMSAASSIDKAADIAKTVSVLTASDGKDIIVPVEDKYLSHYMTKGEMKIIVRVGDDGMDPTEEFRIIRLHKHPKELRFQWKEKEAGEIGTEEAQKVGFIKFTATKYGEDSYILSVPINEIKSSFYGVFRLSSASEEGIPVSAFYLKIYKPGKLI